MRSAFKYARTTAVLLTLATGLWAEDERSTHLVVKVIDQTTAPIAGAEIRIDRSTDSVHPVLLANANGMFAADLRPGAYDLEVQSPGFRSYKKPLDVDQSREQFVTITLAVGGCSPCVTVTTLSGAETASLLYLNEMYSLPPGVYTVVERVQGKSTPPRKEGVDGLSFQMRAGW